MFQKFIEYLKKDDKSVNTIKSSTMKGDINWLHRKYCLQKNKGWNSPRYPRI